MILDQRRNSGYNDAMLIATIVVIAMVFRRYDAFILPQLYAEDGKIFLQQYTELGIASLFKPYAGYLHTVPRLVALAGGIVRYEYAPLIYNFSALVISYCVALYLWHCGKKLQLAHPIVFATAFLFLPLDSEIYMNLTNIIWITSLALICYVFTFGASKKEEATGLKRVVELLLVIILALTGPVSLLMSPVIVLMLWLERKENKLKDKWPLLVILSCGVMQLICLKVIDPGLDRRGPAYYEEGHFIKFLVYNVEHLFFLNRPAFAKVPEQTLTVVSLIILSILFILAAVAYIRVKNKRKYVLLFAAVAYFGSFLAIYWPNEVRILALYSARYYFIPYACIFLICILACDRKMNYAYVGAYLAFISFHGPLIAWALPNADWEQRMTEYRIGMRGEIKINPDGWSVKLPPVPQPFKKIDYRFFKPGDLYIDGTDTTIALWSNNPVVSNAFHMPAGMYSLAVIGQGLAVGGVNPHVHLIIDNEEIGSFTTSDQPDVNAVFDYKHAEDKDITVQLRMDNDTAYEGQDRNGFIWSIKVEKK